MKTRFQSTTFASLLGVMLLGALVIGCGGGGGGGTTSTGTTSTTSTTGTPTDGSTDGTATTGETGSKIVFGEPAADGLTFNVRSVTPDGVTKTTLLANVPTSIVLFSENPASTNDYVFAADPTGSGSYGIYRSPILSPTGATTLVSPRYLAVSSLTVTQNGSQVVYSALDASGNPLLFSVPIGGGTPVEYGASDGSTVSPSDSDTIAYVALPAGSETNDQLFTRSLAAGPSGTATQVTTNTVNHILPAFSRDGTKLAYWEQSATSRLVVRTLSSGATTTLTNPSSLFPQGESFNPTGTRVSIAAGADDGSGQILTQTISTSASPTAIYTNANLLGNYGIYWTDTTGRVIGGNLIGASPSRKLRKH